MYGSQNIRMKRSSKFKFKFNIRYTDSRNRVYALNGDFLQKEGMAD